MKGLRERTDPYRWDMPVFVDAQQDRSFLVPLYFFVEAAVVTSQSGWGSVDSQMNATTCLAAQSLQANAIIGRLDERFSVAFSACDVEGMPVAHELPSPRRGDDRAFS
eukprot:5385493-Prymnesium_polylepis.1